MPTEIIMDIKPNWREIISEQKEDKTGFKLFGGGANIPEPPHIINDNLENDKADLNNE